MTEVLPSWCHRTACAVLWCEHWHVQDLEDPGVTHILVGELQPARLCIQHPSAAAVSTQWLVQCLKEQKRVDHCKHLVHFGQGQPLACPRSTVLDPTRSACMWACRCSQRPQCPACDQHHQPHKLCLDNRPCTALRHAMTGCLAGEAPGNESETESLASPSLGSPSKSLQKFGPWLGHWSPELDSITSTTTLVLQVITATLP